MFFIDIVRVIELINIINEKYYLVRMMNRKTISILGLGWLGLPLAKSFLYNGYYMKGTVTGSVKANELKKSGIDVSLLKLFADKIECSDPDFFKCDVLIINFPPSRTKAIETIYPAQVKQILPFIHQNNVKKVLFVSSTSVYPEVNRIVSEDEVWLPDKPSGKACLNAENILHKDPHFSSTVIRFGGLIGPNRNPSRFIKDGIANGEGNKPVNLIHLYDCIGIINHVIKQKIWGEVINACCPEHPTRAEFYTKAAVAAGLEPPCFDLSSEFQFKKVNSEKLTNLLRYTFKYENPINFLNSPR